MPLLTLVALLLSAHASAQTADSATGDRQGAAPGRAVRLIPPDGDNAGESGSGEVPATSEQAPNGPPLPFPHSAEQSNSESANDEVPESIDDEPGSASVRWSWPRYRLEAPKPEPQTKPARGDTPQPPRAPARPSDSSQEQPTRRVWYGDTNLALDGIAILTSPILVGVGVYLAGPPIVHYRHGNTGRMIASIALRVGLPTLVIASATSRAGSGGGENDMYGGGLLLLMIGGLGALPAMLIDDLALSYARVAESKQTTTATVVPGLAVDHHGMRASVSGFF